MRESCHCVGCGCILQSFLQIEGESQGVFHQPIGLSCVFGQVFLVVGAGGPVAIPQFVVGVKVSVHNCTSLGVEGVEEMADSSLSAWGVEVVDGQ